MDDRQQPGLDAPSPLDIASRVAPRAQERILDDVLGQRGVVRDPIGDGVGHGLVTLVQVVERPELAAGDALQYRAIRVVTDGRHAERERAGRLAHPVLRTGRAGGSPRATRSSTIAAISRLTSSIP